MTTEASPVTSAGRGLTIQRVFAVLLVVQLVNIGMRGTTDPDMWWHLRTGEFICQHGIPRHDIFSFTVSDHEWITHEWLSEVIMWTVYSIGGFPALSIAFAVLSALSLWLVYRCSEGRPYMAGLIALLAALAAAPCFGVRPQMFSLVMVAAFVYVIEGLRDRRLSPRSLFLLPALTVLWVNLHGGYLLGVVVLLTYAAGDSLQRLSTRPDARLLSWAEVRLLAIVAIACLAVAVVNPNGWAIWTYPFGTLGSAAMQQNIAEWRSPDFHAYAYWPFAILMSIGIIGWATTTQRPQWADLFLFLGTAAAGLRSSRHIALFAVVAMPIVARSMAAIARGTRAEWLLVGDSRRTSPSPRAIRLNRAILAVGVLMMGIWDAQRLASNEATIAKVFPVAAVSFLEREGLASQHGWNPYVWGGYLIWRRIPVFVDGRADVYGDQFLSRYFKTLRIADDWREPLDAFGVAYVLVERASPLGALLTSSGEWREVYDDEVARIFRRVGGTA